MAQAAASQRGEAAAAAPQWGRCIVLYAGVPYDGPRIVEQHLADALSSYLPVLYVDPPLSRLGALREPETRASLQGRRLRTLGPRLACLRPLLPPGKERWGMTALSTRLLRRHVAVALGELGAVADVTIVLPPLRPLLAGLRDQRRVFLVIDDYATIGGLIGLAPGRLRRGETRLARDADLVVVTSAVLADKFSAMGYTPLLMPNGCDSSLFAGTEAAPRASDVTLPPPVVGFVGFLSNRADFRLLDAVARRGHSVLLVAPRQGTFAMRSIETLLGRSNVQWVGGRPHEQLPAYMRCIDVGVVPYPDTDFNRASFPLKTLEYLAAGRRVVATDLPAARWLGTDLVRLAPHDPEGFADAVDAALAEPNDETRRRQRLAFAASHSWARRAELLAAALQLPDPRPRDA